MFVRVKSLVMRLMMMIMTMVLMMIKAKLVRKSVVEIQELQEAPVQLVEVEDGQEDAEQVDQDPDSIQHIVTIRSLHKKTSITGVIAPEAKDNIKNQNN